MWIYTISLFTKLLQREFTELYNFLDVCLFEEAMLYWNNFRMIDNPAYVDLYHFFIHEVGYKNLHHFITLFFFYRLY